MDKWIIWCDLNDEQDLLEKLYGDKCLSIRGSTPDDKKIEYERRWREEDIPILITKASMFGHGLNWQHCHNMIFVGLSDSYEQLYQAVRRCWRFGQKYPVNVWIITSEAEGAVKANIERKEKESIKMISEMVEHTKKILVEELKNTHRFTLDYNADKEMKIQPWLIKGGY